MALLRRHLPHAALAGLLLAPGCLDGLSGKDYSGDPLFQVRGQVVSYERPVWPGHPFRVSLFWNVKDPGSELFFLKEQVSTSVSVVFPDAFVVNVFHPPTRDMLVPEDPEYGAALLLVYEDWNDDGIFTLGDEPDELVGGAVSRVVVYFSRAVTAAESPTGLAHPAGFSLLTVPLNCSGQGNLTPEGSEDCGVDLGAPCDPEPCGPGATCFHDPQDLMYPGGYCTLEYDPEGCFPADGAAVYLSQALWVPSCASDADCPRAGYRCTNLPSATGSACQACWPENVSPSYTGGCRPEGNSAPPGTCGSRLGQACASHADCAVDAGPGGYCLKRSLDQDFPGGYCSIYDARDACEPANGHFTYLIVSYWFKRCKGDLDCREGYECFPLYGVCVPTSPVQLEIPKDFDFERDMAPICF